jgi:hypothetical protein
MTTPAGTRVPVIRFPVTILLLVGLFGILLVAERMWVFRLAAQNEKLKQDLSRTETEKSTYQEGIARLSSYTTVAVRAEKEWGLFPPAPERLVFVTPQRRLRDDSLARGETSHAASDRYSAFWPPSVATSPFSRREETVR